MNSLFTHQKLDWTINKLEDQLHADPQNEECLLKLARAVVCRGLFHGGGEKECNRALALARKVLQDDPGSEDALTIAALSLVGIDRPRAAARYLEQANQITDRADIQLAWGRLLTHQGDVGGSIRHFESACRLAPEAWETHLDLGQALLKLGLRRSNDRRIIERSQYHLVQALKKEPSPDQTPRLLKDLGTTCMLTGRLREAEKLFIRLREHTKYAPAARKNLGRVAYELGKYNNAIQHYRQYLRDRPDDPKVLARMAMAWFQLQEYSRARQACSQALIVDPDNVMARQALACTMLEEGENEEAIRVLRELLQDHPEHTPSY